MVPALTAYFFLLGRDDGVTTTGRFFETFAIEKPDAAANRFDKFLVLKLICSLCDGGPTCSQKMCEEFLRNAQLGVVHAVVDHQQEASKSSVRSVITMTGDELSTLCEQRVCISEHYFADPAASFCFFLQNCAWQPQRFTFREYQSLVSGMLCAHENRSADQSFVADQANFDGRFDVNGTDQNNDAIEWKVNDVELFSVFVNSFFREEREDLQLRNETRTIPFGKRS